MKRPASPIAKAIVTGITAAALLVGVELAPDQLEPVVGGVIALGGIFGVWRVPNEEPDPILEVLTGEPEEGDRTTLGTKV